jgi:anaerobic selenocysteine-containing dehydrogenase
MKEVLNTKLSRRTFLKGAAAALASITLGPRFFEYTYAKEGAQKWSYPGPDAVDTDPDVEIFYSSCLQCHNSCTNRVKVVDGIAVKADGNPYSPYNMKLPHEMGPEDDPSEQILPYDTDPAEARKYRGRLCPKGQAILQTTYDPYRIMKPLKRAGPRGSGKWVVLSWEQAIKEIVHGGELPEEDGMRRFEGLKQIRSFDPIDPEIPELGPKANQFVWVVGRAEHGRKDIIKTWIKYAYGSINFFEHTTICEQSHHIGLKHSLDGKDHQINPDVENCEFLVVVGTNPVECNFGPVQFARQLMRARADKGMKMVVVDPRFSRTAAKADRWVPIKPGADAFLGLAMCRWIIENQRYDERYLRNPNKEAANADGEPTWSDATYLVKIENGKPTKFLSGKEAGIGDNEKEPVVLHREEVEAASKAVEGELFVDTVINGIPVKSAFQLFKEEVFKYTIDEYAEMTGISVRDLEWLSREFTSHGKRAHLTFYRGPVQHTNGFYNARALAAVNFLIGNRDWKGGWAKGGGHYHEGGGPGLPYALKEDIVPTAPDAKPRGIPLTREKKNYTDAPNLMKKEGGKPKRPWFPFTSNVYQEIFPSAKDGYPYPVKALFLTKGTPAFSIPASEIQKEILADTKAIPLFIAHDILVAETSKYADYILPDVSILERWGMPHAATSILIKTSKVRQPVIEKLGDIKSAEEILIALSEELGLPKYGAEVSDDEHMYLRMVANIAMEGTPVPDGPKRDLKRFERFRIRAPEAVTDKEWLKVCYVLARGCRVEDPSKAYEGEYLGHKYANVCHFYDEKTGTYQDPISGDTWSGLPRYYPVMTADGKEVRDGLPLHLITWKEMLGGHSRTIGNKWLGEIWPENYIYVNPVDARARGLKTGDRAKIVSATHKDGIIGKVKVTDEIRPGVVGASWHKGHLEAYGARKFDVEGSAQTLSRIAAAGMGMERTPEDVKLRSAGICPNPVMRADERYNVCLQDTIGGSASYYDTKVDLEKV